MEQELEVDASSPLRKQRVGDWLVELNLISSRQLAEAMAKQAETGERLGTLLVKLGYLTERELGDVLLLQETLSSHAALTDFQVDRAVLDMLTTSFARQHKVLPLLLVGKRLLVAVTDKQAHEVIELVSLMTGQIIIPVNFRHQDIEMAIAFFYEGVLLPPSSPEEGGVLRKQRLGDWLVELNLISKPQLAEAMELQRITGERIGTLLIQLGYLTDRELDDILRVQEMLSSHASLTEFPVEPRVLRLLSANFAKQNLAIPLVLMGQRLVVALPDRNNTEQIDRISLLTGHHVIPIALRKPDLEAAIAHFFSEDASAPTRLEKMVKAASSDSEPMKATIKQNIAELVSADDGTVVSLVNSVLLEALESGASDIHFEATDRGISVRSRLDGVMHDAASIPAALAPAALSRLKVLADMNLTETRRPQDGRFTMRHQQDHYDFRVSSIASHWGETMVIRILRPLSIGNLDSLASDDDTRLKFRRLLGAPSGMVLVTGPTGSGKTSTLYACLEALDKTTDSIVTVEDPIEFPLAGIVQIQVQPKIGLTFASALRTILRQDPDVVMLGEIRDSEALEASVAAAMTGHLVLSTLHTNDAISTISRLMDMGAKTYQISSTVSGIVAQRLVRRICTSCAEPYPATPEDRTFLKAGDESLMLKRGKGCSACKSSGYKGRLGVYEILLLNRRLKNLVNAGAPEAELWQAAREMGFRSLLEDGRQRIRQGLTTVEEVVRVLGDGSLEE